MYHATLVRDLIQGLFTFRLAGRQTPSKTPSFNVPLSGRQLHIEIHPPPPCSRMTKAKRR